MECADHGVVFGMGQYAMQRLAPPYHPAPCQCRNHGSFDRTAFLVDHLRRVAGHDRVRHVRNVFLVNGGQRDADRRRTRRIRRIHEHRRTVAARGSSIDAHDHAETARHPHDDDGPSVAVAPFTNVVSMRRRTACATAPIANAIITTTVTPSAACDEWNTWNQ